MQFIKLSYVAFGLFWISGGALLQAQPQAAARSITGSVLGQPQTDIKARDTARTVTCLSNIKQLSLGVLMLVQDHDEKYALKPETFKKAIYPYVKNEEVFKCPSDETGSPAYSFNPHLAGLSLAKLKDPAKTVMLYEGKAGKL